MTTARQSNGRCTDLRKPDFLYIGASKAGSTWLHEMLRSHSRVYVTPAKDTHYFSYNFDRGREWYLGHFRRLGPGKVQGEIDHDYWLADEYAARIKSFLPEAAFLCCLREPVSHLISSYYYYLSEYDMEADLDEFALMVSEADSGPPVQDVLMLKKRNFPGFSAEEICRSLAAYTRAMTDYCSNINRFKSLFPQNRLGIFLYDDLVSDPAGFLQSVYLFLGLDSDRLPANYKSVILPAREPRSPALKRLARDAALFFRRRGLVSLLGPAKNSPMMLCLFYRPIKSKMDISPDLKMELYRKLHGRYTGLPALLGRELPPGWNEELVCSKENRSSSDE